MEQYKQIQLDVETTIHTILAAIPSSQQLLWKILWLTAVSKKHLNILDLEKDINASKDGKSISIPALTSLLEDILDLQEILLIADWDANRLHRYSDDEDMLKNCTIVIEKVDASYWLVSTNFTTQLLIEGKNC
ncbi:MAG: hypothetical protein RLZZ628_507 [Bacteroidota bacterium]|jgi:hypothetical protein